jgi:hypothetical protein
MRPDKKFEVFDSSELNSTGWYEEHCNGETEFAYFICPICGNNTDEGTAADCLLDSIFLPLKLAVDLIKLWRRKKDADVMDVYEYGIPLDNAELRDLIVEYML